MNVAASVFKAYDIRGVVGSTIDERFAEHLGRAFASAALAAGERAVAVGRDGRLSGPALEDFQADVLRTLPSLPEREQIALLGRSRRPLWTALSLEDGKKIWFVAGKPCEPPRLGCSPAQPAAARHGRFRPSPHHGRRIKSRAEKLPRDWRPGAVAAGGRQTRGVGPAKRSTTPTPLPQPDGGG